jgi:hypothetical protein
MITSILIILILSLAVNLFLIIRIGKNLETNFQISAKVQIDQWDDITEIRRIVNDQSHYLIAIDKKIEDSIKTKDLNS